MLFLELFLELLFMFLATGISVATSIWWLFLTIYRLTGSGIEYVARQSPRNRMAFREGIVFSKWIFGRFKNITKPFVWLLSRSALTSFLLFSSQITAFIPIFNCLPRYCVVHFELAVFYFCFSNDFAAAFSDLATQACLIVKIAVVWPWILPVEATLNYWVFID